MGDPDYRTLPPAPRLDETVASTDPDRAPDADDVRNVNQHAALRDE
ncbi:hypothetical protein L2K70_18810 [Nocardioides KLBMP 9356]|uniref:Uncharacterized protein n=1 Tax=Nocardioides potassii TaxID=2911371 RepID=A0ABS9HER8_9ACTN|nr:hypothetical protein [Nocardioides potassii]MCF6379667.1 hypothetical protein [Nocardioides potassii]